MTQSEEVDSNLVATAQDAPLSAAEKKDAKERYESKIEELRSEEKKALENVIITQWRKGQFIDELMANGRKYGNRDVATFAADMDCSVSLANNFWRFFKSYTWDQVQKAIKQQVSFTNLAVLAAVHDVKKREQLQLACSKETPQEKRMQYEELRDVVKKYNTEQREKAENASEKDEDGAPKEKKADNRGGVTPRKTLGAFINKLADFEDKLEEVDGALRDIASMEDEEKKDELAPRIKEMIRIVKRVAPRLERLNERAEEAL